MKPALYIDEMYIYTALVRVAYCVKGKKKGKFYPKTCYGDTEGEYSSFNFGARWRWVVNILILQAAWGLQSLPHPPHPTPACILIVLPHVMKSNVYV